MCSANRQTELSILPWFSKVHYYYYYNRYYYWHYLWSPKHFLKWQKIWGSGVGQGQAVMPFDIYIWLRYEVFLVFFTPRWLVGVTPWTRKTQKELYERRQQQTGDEDVYFVFFLYFLGSTTIPWVKEFSWIQLKWLNPPVKESENTLIVSWYMLVLI